MYLCSCPISLFFDLIGFLHGLVRVTCGSFQWFRVMLCHYRHDARSKDSKKMDCALKKGQRHMRAWVFHRFTPRFFFPSLVLVGFYLFLCWWFCLVGLNVYVCVVLLFASGHAKDVFRCG